MFRSPQPGNPIWGFVNPPNRATILLAGDCERLGFACPPEPNLQKAHSSCNMSLNVPKGPRIFLVYAWASKGFCTAKVYTWCHMEHETW